MACRDAAGFSACCLYSPSSRTFGVFFLDKGREASTVLGSGRGMLTVGAIVLGYLALSFLLRRLVRWTWVAPLVLTVVILGLAAWIVRPYYVDAAAGRRLVAGPVQDPSEVTAPALDRGAPAARQDPGVATRVSSGGIVGLGHDARGTISLIRKDDGSLLVRFENFELEGTPDPRVYLVEGRDVRRPGGVDLGRLPGNQGEALDFAVPAGQDAGPGWTVLVWCRRFSVPIANATQDAI